MYLSTFHALIIHWGFAVCKSPFSLIFLDFYLPRLCRIFQFFSLFSFHCKHFVFLQAIPFRFLRSIFESYFLNFTSAILPFLHSECVTCSLHNSPETPFWRPSHLPFWVSDLPEHPAFPLRKHFPNPLRSYPVWQKTEPSP